MATPHSSKSPFVTRPGEGLTFTTTPTDVMTFLCRGDAAMPDVVTERLAAGDCDPPPSSPQFKDFERLLTKVGE